MVILYILLLTTLNKTIADNETETGLPTQSGAPMSSFKAPVSPMSDAGGLSTPGSPTEGGTLSAKQKMGQAMLEEARKRTVAAALAKKQAEAPTPVTLLEPKVQQSNVSESKKMSDKTKAKGAAPLRGMATANRLRKGSEIKSTMKNDQQFADTMHAWDQTHAKHLVDKQNQELAAHDMPYRYGLDENNLIWVYDHNGSHLADLEEQGFGTTVHDMYSLYAQKVIAAHWEEYAMRAAYNKEHHSKAMTNMWNALESVKKRYHGQFGMHYDTVQSADRPKFEGVEMPYDTVKKSKRGVDFGGVATVYDQVRRGGTINFGSTQPAVFDKVVLSSGGINFNGTTKSSADVKMKQVKSDSSSTIAAPQATQAQIDKWLAGGGEKK